MYKKGSKSFRRPLGYSMTKRAAMLRKLFIFLGLGLVWLFIFSIPVGHQGKKLFTVAHYYIVDTKLVHFVTNLIFTTANKTTNTATDMVDDVVNKAHSVPSK